MKATILYIFAALFASITSAATIKNHFKAKCHGGHLLFRNIGPRLCARALHRTGNPDNPVKGSESVAFLDMPHHARVFGWWATRDSPFCGDLKRRRQMGNKSRGCMGSAKNVKYAGSSWATPASKRKEPTNGTEPVRPDETCESEAAPAAIVLDDGHMYDVEEMPNGLFDQLYDLAANGTGYADLPDVFDHFEEDKEGVQARVQDMQPEEEL